LDNRTGTIVQRGSGQLQVLASQLDNSNGLLGAEGNARVTSRTGDLRNVDGNLYARQELALDVAGALQPAWPGPRRHLADLQIRQALDNSQGNIEAQAPRTSALPQWAPWRPHRGQRHRAADAGISRCAGQPWRHPGQHRWCADADRRQLDNRAEGGQAKLVAGTDLRLQTASLDNAGSMVHAANTLHRSAQAHRYSTLVASSAQATCCAWILPRWTTATAGCSVARAS
jgi:filamentous hemagglutinin